MLLLLRAESTCTKPRTLVLQGGEVTDDDIISAWTLIIMNICRQKFPVVLIFDPMSKTEMMVRWIYGGTDFNCILLW